MPRLAPLIKATLPFRDISTPIYNPPFGVFSFLHEMLALSPSTVKAYARLDTAPTGSSGIRED
jgi:hypothetical protein